MLTVISSLFLYFVRGLPKIIMAVLIYCTYYVKGCYVLPVVRGSTYDTYVGWGYERC